MEIIGYGEDALTIWALKYKVKDILNILNDKSDTSKCKVLFRPSFGRRGGGQSSQFGEFDFILLSECCLYLGESKWDQSSEKIGNGKLSLRNEQKLRHKIFQFYVKEWAFGQYESWNDFERKGMVKLENEGLKNKPIAPDGSLLANNIQTVLKVIKTHYKNLPEIKNVLIYFYKGLDPEQLPKEAGDDFMVVSIDYSANLLDNYILIDNSVDS